MAAHLGVIHLRHVGLDAGRRQHAALHHHHHFRLMLGMHGGSPDVEFVQELAGVRQDEAHGLPSLHLNRLRSEEHTSELQSLMRISYAVFCLKKKTKNITRYTTSSHIPCHK